MRKMIFLGAFILLPVLISGQSSFEAMLQARSYAVSGDYSGAAALLSEAVGRKPEARLYTERANVRMMSGDYSGAADDYTMANALSVHSGDYGLSRIYALKGDAETSLRYLELHLHSDFRKSEKEILLDPVYASIENTPQWRQFWKRDWYSGLETGLSEIEYYLASGKRNNASEKLLELQGIYKGREEVEYARALVSYSSQNYSDALKILAGMSASSVPLNEKVLRLLARTQSESSNPAGASSTYSKLIDMEIPDAQLFLLRADCYRRTGETTRAMADAEKYLSLYPRDKPALRLAGKIKTAEGNSLKALGYFSENLKYHPSDPECYIDRGGAYMMLRSWEPAINDYSMSLDLDPANPEAWFSKGLARFNSGNTEDACHDFRQALKLGNRKAAEYISRYCIR